MSAVMHTRSCRTPCVAPLSYLPSPPFPMRIQVKILRRHVLQPWRVPFTIKALGELILVVTQLYGAGVLTSRAVLPLLSPAPHEPSEAVPHLSL